MFRAFLAVFCLFGIDLCAEVAEFERPPAGLKQRVIESYDQDEEDMTVEILRSKTVEVFDEKGDLVSREVMDPIGKTEKFTYTHIYGEKKEIAERTELDALGVALRRWRYHMNEVGILEVTVTVFDSEQDREYCYRFNKRGTVDEFSQKDGDVISRKIINKYQEDGSLSEQYEFSEGKLVCRSEYQYNSKGRMIRRLCYKKNGQLSVEEEFNTVGDTELYSVYDHYGKEVIEQLAQEYKYDGSGRVLEVRWSKGKIANRKTKYHYGANYYHYEFSEKK